MEADQKRKRKGTDREGREIKKKSGKEKIKMECERKECVSQIKQELSHASLNVISLQDEKKGKWIPPMCYPRY